MKTPLPPQPTIPQMGEIYRHYKTKDLYVVIGYAWDTERESWSILYATNDYGYKPVFARPVDVFNGLVGDVPRFHLLDSAL